MRSSSGRPAGAALAALALLAAACTVPDAGSTVDYRQEPATAAGPGLVHVVVEIPAGTNAKWEVDKTTGALEWELVDGIPRVVQYLAYPANYGMIPGTALPEELGGDGDPLDIVVLGEALERGAIVEVRPVAVLRLLDDGERDDKIVAVPLGGPFAAVTDLSGLDATYPGVTTILETWFRNYKGPGRIESEGFGDAAMADSVVAVARAWYGEGAPAP